MKPEADEAVVVVRRALLSVSDKSGLVELGRALAGSGAQIISTGGTAAALVGAGIAVTAVEDVTGFAEMMDGRVKTLHPKIHGAILARRDSPGHVRSMGEHGITPIDLVCVNLYPFERTIAREGISREEALEQIDIGGPALVRSAAKNSESVAVVTGPGQYAGVIEEVRTLGGTTLELRRRLAREAFAGTSGYDAAIARYLARVGGELDEEEEFPASLGPGLVKVAGLRYGENPHQRAALYRDERYRGASIGLTRQRHGKVMSYNNIGDAAAALALVEDLARSAPGKCAAVVVKHANACGAALAGSAREAILLALRGDPVAAYGGVLALGGVGGEGGRLDTGAAEAVCGEGVFLEVVVAASVEEGALERVRNRWANLRLLEVGAISQEPGSQFTFRSIPGGALGQSADRVDERPEEWTLRAGPEPGAALRQEAGAVWLMAKSLASNAIAIGGRDVGEVGGGGGGAGGGVRLFGAGAGQMDRVTACRGAVEKAGALARGAIAASDAFFPFADGPALLIEAGIRVIVHPGGSKRDQETIDLCAGRGVSLLTTGVRHFRH